MHFNILPLLLIIDAIDPWKLSGFPLAGMYPRLYTNANKSSSANCELAASLPKGRDRTSGRLIIFHSEPMMVQNWDTTKAG